MTYNKDSFLAGIAVGRRLKGWAGGDAGISPPGGTGSGIIFDKNMTFSYPGIVMEVTTIIFGEYIEEE